MMTHTSAKLEVSSSTYDEIRAKLEAAGHDGAFVQNGAGEPVIDIHGIALVRPGRPFARAVQKGIDDADDGRTMPYRGNVREWLESWGTEGEQTVRKDATS